MSAYYRSVWTQSPIDADSLPFVVRRASPDAHTACRQAESVLQAFVTDWAWWFENLASHVDPTIADQRDWLRRFPFRNEERVDIHPPALRIPHEVSRDSVMPFVV